jgi:hypothetical protein
VPSEYNLFQKMERLYSTIAQMSRAADMTAIRRSAVFLFLMKENIPDSIVTTGLTKTRRRKIAVKSPDLGCISRTAARKKTGTVSMKSLLCIFSSSLQFTAFPPAAGLASQADSAAGSKFRLRE